MPKSAIHTSNEPGSVISEHIAQNLRPFSAGVSTPADSSRLKLTFAARRRSDRLDFTFMLTGASGAELERLAIPTTNEPQSHRRRDELWKNTCLEIFVGPDRSTSYLEMNLSPSGDWNLYAFDGYREGMRPADHQVGPLTQFERAADSMIWHGSLSAGDAESGELATLFKSPSLVMGVAAVMEYKSGEREYWALVHAADKPDFHLRESFRLTF